MSSSDSMHIEVHNKSAIYTAMTKSFVNLRLNTQDIDEAMRDPLAYVSKSFRHQASSMSRFRNEDLLRIRKLRDSIRKNAHLDDATMRAILRGAEPALIDTGILDHLDDPPDETDLSQIEKLFEGEPGKLVLRKLALDNAEFSTVEERGMFTRKLSEMGGIEMSTARGMGFKDIIYIEDFPMAVVNVGYRRGYSIEDVQDSELRVHGTDSNGRVQIYSETYSTEGILFLLDPSKVMAWCEEWTGEKIGESGDIPDALTLAALTTGHEYGLRPCDEQRGKSGTVAESKGHTIFTLLHSLSHSAILACSIKSGFHANSLSEYISPGCLGFYIFVNKMYQKGMGGLENLFSGDIMGILQRIRDVSMDCIHDPFCWDRIGACHACIVLSETSCRAYNSHLDRKVIHGGQVGSMMKKGYLDHSGG
jgi:hypothetical protein